MFVDQDLLFAHCGQVSAVDAVVSILSLWKLLRALSVLLRDLDRVKWESGNVSDSCPVSMTLGRVWLYSF